MWVFPPSFECLRISWSWQRHNKWRKNSKSAMEKQGFSLFFYNNLCRFNVTDLVHTRYLVSEVPSLRDMCNWLFFVFTGEGGPAAQSNNFGFYTIFSTFLMWPIKYPIFDIRSSFFLFLSYQSSVFNIFHYSQWWCWWKLYFFPHLFLQTTYLLPVSWTAMAMRAFIKSS